MSDMVVRIKHNKSCPYVIVSKSTLYDPVISLEAKGLLIFLLSKPDDWVFHIRQIAAELKRDKNTIQRVMKELVTTGYCSKAYQTREKHGTFSHCEYIIFESLEARGEYMESIRNQFTPGGTRLE